MKYLGFLFFLIFGMSPIWAQNGPKLVVMEFTALGEATQDMGKTTAGLVEAHLAMKKFLIASRINVLELFPEKTYSGEAQVLELAKTQKQRLKDLEVHSILLGEISRIDGRFYGKFKLLQVESATFEEGFSVVIYGSKDYQSFIKELLDALAGALPKEMEFKIDSVIADQPFHVDPLQEEPEVEENELVPELKIIQPPEKESGCGISFGKKRIARKKSGKSPKTTLSAGLVWLKNHQSSEGYWSADNFMAHCKDSTCSGPGKEWTTIGQTGLALLAFLAAGNTHRSGTYKEQVRNALKYMKETQTPDGSFGPQKRGTHYMYNHAIATLAMTEAYEISGRSPLLKGTAQAGIDYLVKAQNPGLAWRYEPQSGDNDSSVSAWAVMALKSAQIANLNVPVEAFEYAKNWYDSATDDSYYRVGYMRRGDPGARLAGFEGKFAPSEAMTAAGMAARIFMGEDPAKNPTIRGGAELLMENLPEWNTGGIDGESTIDFYYWYYGTLAMFHVGGEQWKTWNSKVVKALVSTQKTEGCAAGSWDPIDAWGSEGGRVYATALNMLTLE
ncbi:MAG: hypothetical protein AABZ60_24765 [Planctomycetota bacterium]